eukprot:CAMPEP_0173120216 /NCGR_PEP_ID=MMETSP1102-20130122/52337_1 /TAXON_ID=49646 /ORGANISM="Geminigera sp., Strain Caron Lab Isolate" /LENGTH=148 /DNA_ID=CAMNT_0014026147 /DNA_START=155 /DNA_END=601 /DNA_ORIENTATION=-
MIEGVDSRHDACPMSVRRQQFAMSETTGCTTTERCPGCAWPSSCGAHASAAGERRGAKGGGGRCAAKTRGLDSVPGRGVPTRRPCGVQGWREAAPGACAPSAHPAEASQYSYTMHAPCLHSGTAVRRSSREKSGVDASRKGARNHAEH